MTCPSTPAGRDGTLPPAPRWFDGLAPLSASVRCSGGNHLVTWQRGRLVLHDHDINAELALAALGGGPVACLDIVEAVRRYLPRLPLTGLWSTEGDPTGLVLPEAPSGRARVDDERRLDALRALPAAFRRRLALAGFVAAGRGPSPLSAWQAPPFATVLTSLVVPAVLRSLQDAGCPAHTSGDGVDVRWTTIGPGQRARLDGRVGRGGGWARLELSPSWVAEIWAHGLAHQRGHLIVARAGPCRPQGNTGRPTAAQAVLHGATWHRGPDGSWAPVMATVGVAPPDVADAGAAGASATRPGAVRAG